MNIYHIDIDQATLVDVYAVLFDPANGDTLDEFIELAGVTVYRDGPDDVARRRFERALRKEINSRRRNRRARGLEAVTV